MKIKKSIRKKISIVIISIISVVLFWGSIQLIDRALNIEYSYNSSVVSEFRNLEY